MEEAVEQTCCFLNPTEAKHSLLKYLLVVKVFLPVEQQLRVCYLVISRGFVGVCKAIPRPHM